MSEQKDEWWVSRGGHTFGPVTFAQVVESAKEGRLEPRTDMLFGGGLSDWVPAGEVEGVFERRAAGDSAWEAPPVMGDEKFSESGEFDFKKTGAEKLDLPGATRLTWFLGMTLFPGLLVAGISVLIPMVAPRLGQGHEPYAALLFLVVPLVMLWVTLMRFQNLAMHRWCVLLLWVPILNLWLQYRLFACPSGYGHTKRMDGIGTVLAVIFWLGTALSMASAGFIFAQGGMAALKASEENGQLRVLLNQWDELKGAVEKDGGAEAPAPEN
ncbi:hypothetical protein HNR46_001791 [Haloferula luteola]|uniref:GYF domain-containing protein n=1 Tax=Haloferula luteola TaxID=595692 RepID=A0A840V7J3_9BACT|nr:DUF4339 domain-containing protein [Haloferula luteola]MBB5351554.1 hypothetical protein [Haloferula luteola]